MAPRSRTARRGAIVGLLTSIFVAGVTAPAHAVDASDYESRSGAIEIVSVNSQEIQGNGDSGWKGCGTGEQVTMSDDDRYVAFTSVATNLDPRDGDLAIQDIFVRDRYKGTTELVSLDTNGGPAQPPDDLNIGDLVCLALSSNPAISGNGRFVAFQSLAQLAEDDTNIYNDVYVYDRKVHETELISKTSSGEPADGDLAHDGISISSNGRFVTFGSYAPNLRGEPNQLEGVVCGLGELEVFFACGPSQVYVHDRKTEKTKLISKGVDGAPGNHNSFHTEVSGLGNLIVFVSNATNMRAEDPSDLACTNPIFPVITPNEACLQVYAHDLKSGKNELVSSDSHGSVGQPVLSRAQIINWSGERSISSDGRFIVFESSAQLVPEWDMSAGNQIFVKDRRTGRTERVTVTSEGIPLSAGSGPSISADGRYLVFSAYARDEMGCPLGDGPTSSSLCEGRVDMTVGRVKRLGYSCQRPMDTRPRFRR